MSQLNPLKSFTQLTLGERVDRATANITNGLPLFNILGGRVAVNLILGEVTTIMETKTILLKLQANPTIGTTNDICADLDMTAKEAGALLTIAGAAATALQAGSSGAVIGQAVPIVVAVGAITASVGATHTGSIKWSLFYTPIDDGAYVEAA
jgi:hypothetical protein